MNITQFIKYLNKTRKWQIQGSYYTRIEEWKNWWQGWYEPFHLIRETRFDGSLSRPSNVPDEDAEAGL